jgi:hypothetical protein
MDLSHRGHASPARESDADQKMRLSLSAGRKEQVPLWIVAYGVFFER